MVVMAGEFGTAIVFRPHRIRCVDSSLLPIAISNKLKNSSIASLKLTDYFSQSHLALAIVIQKSKPHAISTKEYCATLRKSIRNAQSLGNHVHRLVDSGDFWKEQCEQALRKEKEMKCRVTLLEKQLATSSQGDCSLDSLQALHEQKFWETIITDASFHSTLIPSESDQDQSWQNAISLSSYLIRLGNHRKALESALGDSNQPVRLDDVVTFASNIFSILRTIIEESCSTLCLLKTDDEDRRCLAIFRQLFSKMDVSYRCCFDALGELSETIPGRLKRPELIYHLATFFDQVLKQLHKISNLQYENKKSDFVSRLQGKRQRIEVRRQSEFTVNLHLTRMLVSIIENIRWDMRHPSHKEVFEGIMFSVLNHTGRLLSLAIFEEHVAASSAPGNIAVSGEDYSGFSDDLKCESRYLVEILRAVMVAHTNMGQGQNANLIRYAARKIHATLIDGAIGGLPDTFKLPVVPDSSFDMTAENNTIEEYGSEWFLKTVWALVGWESV